MTDTPTSRPPAPANSILGRIAARREELLKEQVTVLPIPRWDDPEIFVRYHLVSHEEIRACLSAIEKAKGKEKGKVELLANCDVLIKACDGVFVKEGDKEFSFDPDGPNEPLTRFDDRLALALDMDEHSTARQVVRKLFLAEGDILTTAGTVMEFCGYKQDAIEEAMAGE